MTAEEVQDPYEILGLTHTATYEQVRERYKSLAIANHPDKLHHLSTEERSEREDYFKRVTVAYNMIVESGGKTSAATDGTTASARYWRDIWERVASKNVWATFVDVADSYLRRSKHRVRVPVTFADVRLERLKRVQLFLRGVEEPVRLTVRCEEFPATTYEYEAADGSYHHIDIELVWASGGDDGLFDVDDEGNLYICVSLNWWTYIHGTEFILPYVDGSEVTVKVPPFHALGEDIVMPTLGVRPTKDLRVELELIGVSTDQWHTVSDAERDEFCRILKKMYGMTSSGVGNPKSI